MFALAILFGILSLAAGQNRLVYYCGFESDRCGLSGDPTAWIRYNTKTPSANTGPASAYNGSYFVYFESSDPNYLNSLSLPLSLTLPANISTTAVRLQYALHAFGSGIQSLIVRIYSDNNVLLQEDKILSSQLQTSSNDPWVIMNKIYSFASVVKRIDFVVNANQWTADVAIDDLALYSAGCGVCSINGQCQNTANGQQCVCLSGYAGDGYTCLPNCPLACDPVKAQCVVSMGVASCQCLPQYGSGSGLASAGSSSCSICGTCNANAQCVAGASGNQQCACLSGYTGDGYTCTPNCLSPCDPIKAQCVVSGGVASCQCKPGFGSGTGLASAGNSSCSMNMCGSTQCSPYADCVMDSGLPVCKCRPGFVCGANCVTQGLCSNYATCSVVNGVETCMCDMQYYGDGFSGPGRTGCKSKCDLANCGLYSRCVLNSAYAVTCQCNDNFISNGTSCVDINECLTPGWCRGSNTYCVNSVGGYSCECINSYAPDILTSGRNRSCSIYQQCTIGKSCSNCNNIVSPTYVLPATMFGVNDGDQDMARQFLNIWSNKNVKQYFKMAKCDLHMLGMLIANITAYTTQIDNMTDNVNAVSLVVRDLINCNPYEMLEPEWWNLYKKLNNQQITFKQVRIDLDMKVLLLKQEFSRCEEVNSNWFRRALEWFTPVQY